MLELMVVVAIFLIVTGVVMTDIPNFGRKGALDLTTQEVAGCVRSAQTYANSRKAADSDDEVGAALETEAITIFLDADNDHIKDFSEDIFDTCTLKGYTLSAPEGVVNIIFPSTNYKKTIKSNLEPEFYNSSGIVVPSLSNATIEVTSVRNNERRCVFVSASGQITVGSCI